MDMLSCRTCGNALVMLVLVAGLWRCDPWFSYSPYESRLDKKYYGIGEANMAAVKSRDAKDSKAFKIALISDTHYHFSKLDDAIADINERNYFDFVIVTGDLTDNGLKQEFVFFHESMKNLSVPYLTVIGNHDYLANGESVYTQMYGPVNYTVVFNNVKFVLFDNVRWESEKEPDFAWLGRMLENDSGYDHVIPVSHIPPFDGQMDTYRESFHNALVRSGVRLSIHGHSHDYSLEELYGDGVLYHTVSSPQKRAYTEVRVTPDAVEIENIAY